MRKSILKMEKHSYTSYWKSYSTGHKGIGGHKKKEKNSKSKNKTLRYFDNLKKKQQDQSSKNWCYTESFVTDNLKSQNSTAFCFENTKLLK